MPNNHDISEAESLDLFWMQRALELAHQAEAEGEVPVGAILVKEDQVVGEGWNAPIGEHDPTAHAEMQAITAATSHLGGKYLTDCTMYVTVEPCAMCAGALAWSQIATLVYGAPDDKKGYTTVTQGLLHPSKSWRRSPGPR